jgi:hypothetical protein
VDELTGEMCCLMNLLLLANRTREMSHIVNSLSVDITERQGMVYCTGFDGVGEFDPINQMPAAQFARLNMRQAMRQWQAAADN